MQSVATPSIWPIQRKWRCGAVAACLAWTTATQADTGAAGAAAAQSRPTVVLQAGLASDSSVWRGVVDALQPYLATVALDRPGHGSEPATSSPRDACTVAREQRQKLQQLELKPPYLLVGHSLGGSYQYAYAKLFPEDVAGLVLVDATPPGHWARMQAQAPTQAAVVKIMRSLVFSAVDRREFDAQADCLEQLDPGSALAVPTRVLVAGRFRPEEKGVFETMMLRSRQQWLALTGANELTVVWDAAHFIPTDSPEEVAQAVLALAGRRDVRISPAPATTEGLPMAEGDTRDKVLAVWGQPTETIPAGASEVWVYNRRINIPSLLGYLPVVGDVIELVSLALQRRNNHEVIVQFDAQGIVTKAKRRKLE